MDTKVFIYMQLDCALKCISRKHMDWNPKPSYLVLRHAHTKLYNECGISRTVNPGE